MIETGDDADAAAPIVLARGLGIDDEHQARIKLPSGIDGLDPDPKIAWGLPLEPLSPPVDRGDYVGLAAAVFLHLALAAMFSAKWSSPPEPIPPGMMEVSIVNPGALPEGDPAGVRNPPPVPAPDVAPKEQVRADVEQKAPDPDSPPDPDVKPEPEQAKPATENTAEKQQIEAPPSPTDGAGALALGAKTHGNAEGLDPRLSASVGQAVATRVRTCWTPPSSGIPLGTATMIVVLYAPDGSVEGDPRVVRIINEQEVPVTEPNPWELEAVEAIRRCSPIGLPAAIYGYWREVEVQIFSAPPAPTSMRP